MPSRTLLGALYILLRVSNLFVLTRRLPTAKVVGRAAGDTLVLSVCSSDKKRHHKSWLIMGICRHMDRIWTTCIYTTY